MYKRRRTRNGNGSATRRAFRAPRRTYPMRPGGWRGYPLRRANAEKNAQTGAIVADPAANAGTTHLLNGISPGTGFNERVGRKFVIKSIQLRLHLSYRYMGDTSMAYGAVPAGILRVVLVWDKQPNGVTPAITDIFVTNNAQSMTNLDNRNRFNILMDKVYSTPNMAQGETNAVDDHCISLGGTVCKKYKKCNLTTINNAGAAGTVADITTGALWLVLLSDATANDNPTVHHHVAGTARIRYLDL